MAYHLNRDYYTQSNVPLNAYQISYITALFLRHVLGYMVVGQTNFNIDGFTLASGTASPNLAGVNISGASSIYTVQVPSGLWTVSSSDIGKIVVLKSTMNPLFNSGCFLITSVATGASNTWIIDWRSGDTPPAETGGTTGCQWWLVGNDAGVPQTTGTNTSTGYRGDNSVGTSTNSRIILQSPHSTGWQVRICCENFTDYFSNSTCCLVTYAPGLGGTSSGDFPTQAQGGTHLHVPMWLSTNGGNNPALGMAVGTGDQNANVPRRIWIGGDDTGQAVAVMVRRAAVSGPPNHSMVIFGIPSNEVAPTLPTIQRLFVIGNANSETNGSYMNLALWCGAFQSGGMQGTSWSYNNYPISASPSMWTYIEGVSQGSGPQFSSNGGDSPFAGGTELMAVDLIAGSTLSWYSANFPYQFSNFDIRLMGTIPFIRSGRANFAGPFQATTDVNKAWVHCANGVFLQYGGPTPMV
jgi:hypothetical protein